MDYYEKYLKYKKKYIELKNQIGGDKPIIQQIDKINLFHDSEMEMYLNPIYGYYMCENIKRKTRLFILLNTSNY